MKYILLELFLEGVTVALILCFCFAAYLTFGISRVFRFKTGCDVTLKQAYCWFESSVVFVFKSVFWVLLFPPLQFASRLLYRLYSWRPETPWVLRIICGIKRFATLALLDVEQFKEEISEVAGEEMLLSKAGNDPVHYTPVADRGDDVPGPEKAVIIMAPVSRIEVAKHRDKMIKFKGGTVNGMTSSSVTLKLVMDQIVTWKNIYVIGDDGQRVELVWDPKKKIESYDQLPLDLKNELESVFGEGGYSELSDVRFERSYHKTMDDEDEEDDGDDDDDLFADING